MLHSGKTIGLTLVALAGLLLAACGGGADADLPLDAATLPAPGVAIETVLPTVMGETTPVATVEPVVAPEQLFGLWANAGSTLAVCPSGVLVAEEGSGQFRNGDAGGLVLDDQELGEDVRIEAMFVDDRLELTREVRDEGQSNFYARVMDASEPTSMVGGWQRWQLGVTTFETWIFSGDGSLTVSGEFEREDTWAADGYVIRFGNGLNGVVCNLGDVMALGLPQEVLLFARGTEALATLNTAMLAVQDAGP